MPLPHHCPDSTSKPLRLLRPRFGGHLRWFVTVRTPTSSPVSDTRSYIGRPPAAPPLFVRAMSVRRFFSLLLFVIAVDVCPIRLQNLFYIARVCRREDDGSFFFSNFSPFTPVRAGRRFLLSSFVVEMFFLLSLRCRPEALTSYLPRSAFAGACNPPLGPGACSMKNSAAGLYFFGPPARRYSTVKRKLPSQKTRNTPPQPFPIETPRVWSVGSFVDFPPALSSPETVYFSFFVVLTTVFGVREVSLIWVSSIDPFRLLRFLHESQFLSGTVIGGPEI